ncbi:saccharopine dehydrogenase family protein [Limnoglobus roseus]|uniref:Lysine 6-dehydrogenase n=1 Tax=Limnoglobus roseus TaxID=2598579 RepID=A0A5C1AFM0_9BACT|nr:saccharopine dehydrogenase C-terminal domain-containing protein [Limnoglobus roseus]QEL15944.1 Lysine 6-dehydrogenase [Limnoglobus roseus]
MTNVVLLGAGKIGRMIARFLADTGDYRVRIADVDADTLARFHRPNVEPVTVDAANAASLTKAMHGCSLVISALSFSLNPLIAEIAHDLGLSYFDLTEDVETTRRVRAVAARAKPGQIFMPQCGLAPGFVSILTNHAAKGFDKLDTVHMRVGALPQFPTNALKYNLTWSTDGLINEYCNPCEAIHNGRRLELLPLEGLERFDLDGVEYEAFNTSGGLGTLCETLDGQVRELNYKTVRYPGHRDLATFLVNELRLSERRELLKDVLERAVPITYQDVVIVFCTVKGWRKGRYVQHSEAKKVYPRTFDGEIWSAIQVTTAAAICAAVDLHVADRLPSQGFVKQEDVDYAEFMANRFGKHYCSM